MFDESQNVRQWSKSFVTACSETPMTGDHFITGHEVALRTIFNLIARTTNQDDPVTFHTPSVEGQTFLVGSSFFSTSDPNEVWVGFCQVLRQIPTEVMLRAYGGIDCRRVVTGHLHDVGSRMRITLVCKQNAADRFSSIRVCAYTKMHALPS